MEPVLRIMTIRLAEKINEDKEYAGKLAIEDISHYKADEKKAGGK